MLQRSVLVLCGAVLCVITLGLISCQKLPEAKTPLRGQVRGSLAIEPAPFVDAVPDEFDLIGVTSSGDYPAWAQAWFVRPDRSIVVVWVNVVSGNILDRTLVIPRR